MISSNKNEQILNKLWQVLRQNTIGWQNKNLRLNLFNLLKNLFPISLSRDSKKHKKKFSQK